MKAVTGVGEPWYTSGVHAWNGTAATLNPSPTSSRANPAQQHAARHQTLSARHCADAGEVGGAGGAVDEGDAVEEEGGREGAAARSTSSPPRSTRRGGGGSRPARTGRSTGLEPEEEHDEVVGRRHDHPARRRQQQEDVELGSVEVLAAQVGVGQQRRRGPPRSTRRRRRRRRTRRRRSCSRTPAAAASPAHRAPSHSQRPRRAQPAAVHDGDERRRSRAPAGDVTRRRDRQQDHGADDHGDASGRCRSRSSSGTTIGPSDSPVAWARSSRSLAPPSSSALGRRHGCLEVGVLLDVGDEPVDRRARCGRAPASGRRRGTR